MTEENKSFYKIVGENIERERKRQKLSAEELANRIGVTKKTVRRYETGDIRINVDRLESIAQALIVSVDYLTESSPNEKDNPINKDKALADVVAEAMLGDNEELKELMEAASDLDESQLKILIQFIKAMKTDKKST